MKQKKVIQLVQLIRTVLESMPVYSIRLQIHKLSPNLSRLFESTQEWNGHLKQSIMKRRTIGWLQLKVFPQPE